MKAGCEQGHWTYLEQVQDLPGAVAHGSGLTPWGPHSISMRSIPSRNPAPAPWVPATCTGAQPLGACRSPL